MGNNKNYIYERRRSLVSVKSFNRRAEVLLNTKAAAQTKVFVANLWGKIKKMAKMRLGNRLGTIYKASKRQSKISEPGLFNPHQNDQG
jgi:hypothetical protein